MVSTNNGTTRVSGSGPESCPRERSVATLLPDNRARLRKQYEVESIVLGHGYRAVATCQPDRNIVNLVR